MFGLIWFWCIKWLSGVKRFWMIIFCMMRWLQIILWWFKWVFGLETSAQCTDFQVRLGKRYMRQYLTTLLVMDIESAKRFQREYFRDKKFYQYISNLSCIDIKKRSLLVRKADFFSLLLTLPVTILGESCWFWNNLPISLLSVVLNLITFFNRR